MCAPTPASAPLWITRTDPCCTNNTRNWTPFCSRCRGRCGISSRCGSGTATWWADGDFYRRQYPDILPGFYSDKRSWISIRLDGAVPQEEVLHLARRSWQLVFAKLTKKAQRAILEGGGSPG